MRESHGKLRRVVKKSGKMGDSRSAASDVTLFKVLDATHTRDMRGVCNVSVSFIAAQSRVVCGVSYHS